MMVRNDHVRRVKSPPPRKACTRLRLRIFRNEHGAWTQVRVETANRLQNAPSKHHVRTQQRAPFDVGARGVELAFGCRSDGHGKIRGIEEFHSAAREADLGVGEDLSDAVYVIGGDITVIIEERDDFALTFPQRQIETTALSRPGLMEQSDGKACAAGKRGENVAGAIGRSIINDDQFPCMG